MAVLTVATCQFPVGAEIGANLRYVKRQMVTASQRGARVAHFPEGSLSGYAGADFESFAGFDWNLLRDATGEIAGHARRLRLWVVLGSAHRLSGPHKPHNSLYVINDSGQIAERYDKRFCSGDPDGRSGDLAHYSPGSHSSVWDIDGVRCVLVSTVDTGQRLYDSTAAWRERAMTGILHSGTVVSDSRSDDRTRT